LIRVLLHKQEIFAIMLFFLVFVVLFSSTIMYLIEYPAQPDKFSSIPAAMWWSIMTVTTVGYGDIVPVTPLGKLIGSVITLAGVLVLALPSAILATGFIEEREKSREEYTSPEKIIIHGDLVRHFTNMHDKGILPDQEYEKYLEKIHRLIKR
jgi:voltage-gated potassium channel